MPFCLGELSDESPRSRLSQDHGLFVALDQPLQFEFGESSIDGLMCEADFGGNHLPGPLEIYTS